MPDHVSGFFETKEAVHALTQNLQRFVPREKIKVQGLSQSFPDYANGSRGHLLLSAEVDDENRQFVRQLFLDYGGSDVSLQ